MNIWKVFVTQNKSKKKLKFFLLENNKNMKFLVINSDYSVICTFRVGVVWIK